MTKDKRTAVWDRDLALEAYRFEGADQCFPAHFHEHYVLGFLRSGSRSLTCGDVQCVIRAGDFVVFNPHATHACESADGSLMDWRCLNISTDTMRRAVAELTGTPGLPQLAAVTPLSPHTPALARLHRLVLENRSAMEKEEAFFFLLERLLAAGVPPLTPPAEGAAALELARAHMQLHYAAAITLEQLGSLAGMNKYTFLRSFSRQYGITPHQYLQTLRVNNAKLLLEQGQPAVQAAGETGFTDQSHFTRVFKQLVGLTPRQYQNMFREDTANG